MPPSTVTIGISSSQNFCPTSEGIANEFLCEDADGIVLSLLQLTAVPILTWSSASLRFYITKRYKIRHVKISAYIPSTKGIAEVGHKPFIRALRKLTKGTGRRWKDHLPALVRTGTPSMQVPK
jgi:hypothetical protein